MKWELNKLVIHYYEIKDREFQERLAEVIQALVDKRSQLKKISSSPQVLNKDECPLTQAQPAARQAA